MGNINQWNETQQIFGENELSSYHPSRLVNHVELMGEHSWRQEICGAGADGGSPHGASTGRWLFDHHQLVWLCP